MQNVINTRPRLLRGDNLNLIILLVFQVLAVVVFLSAPLLANRWLQDYSRFSIFERGMYFYLPYFLGLIFLICSLWVFARRRNDGIGQVYSLFTTTTAIGLFCLFDAYTSQRLTALWVLSVAIAGGGLINLALIFPEQVRVNSHYSLIRYLGYLPAGLLVLLALLFRSASGYVSSFASIWLMAAVFITLAVVFFIGSTIVRRIDSPSPMVRDQASVIIWGSAIAFGPLILWFLGYLVQLEINFPPLLFAPVGVFPVCIGYAILRYRLLDTRSILSRLIMYSLFLVFVAVSYALLVSGLSMIFGDLLQNRHPILVGLAVFIIAMLVYPLRTRLQKRLDAVFFRGQEVFQESLQTFGRELTQLSDLDKILQLIGDYVEKAISPSRLFIYVIDDSATFYTASLDETGERASDIHFAKNGGLAQLLIQRGATIFLGDGDNLPEELKVDQARLALLGAQLFVPILGQTGMSGWLALGERISGEPYTTQVIEYLESLCDQASLALARSKVVSALEHRVREMDTITKVAEGINLKLAFEDLLDMFYIQTKNLIPTLDFRITLRDESGEDCHHVFYIANDKRILSRENPSYTVNHGLEAELVRSQQAIVTVDYVGECKQRGLSSDTDDLHAWMGVPLNVGTETIGAVSLGSRNPAVLYTNDQVNLLQAIADLVAGAIVKARLLDESQKQARQMATLNELARSLTSTLELDPLLKRIMTSAVEMLDCEAGSLLLVDEQTGESVFEVALGSVGTELEGQRLPPGVGLVGKAVMTKKALIENDVKRSEDWFNVDEQTGFSSKDLLVVPMVVKDRAIGVLEILNKKDRSPFNSKDLDLLTAFTAQAAIAIENARLYTQTDQALAERVDELSVMQRIDRELNASLDIERVMSITLEWSIRRSKAIAGLIGLVEDENLRVMTNVGYSEGHLVGVETPIIKDLPGFSEILSRAEAQPFVSTFGKPGNGSHIEDDTKDDLSKREFSHLLPAARSQIIIPIKRESDVIGAIFLESTNSTEFSDDIVAFLSRLSDHAAMAITNAQLYAEVQRANLAKSQFVSLAAHELKNPLTSIKGYSDLLVGGSVGKVSSGQAGFLKTIRSNADRMGTLVSDLQDISRIEAGQLRLNFSRASLAEIISEVVSSLENQIEEKGQILEMHLPDDLPTVWCDNTRAIQIITNLVSNSIKYTPERGSIVIRVECVANEWDLDGEKQLVLVSVEDTGIGISQSDQKKIFQQFFRSDDNQVREATGTGLGLSITKRLVELQGGQIWFESELEQGTTFHFTVPVSRVD
jgi:signal transduction histidine kinase